MPTYHYTGTDGDDRYEMSNIFPFEIEFYMHGMGGNDELVGAFLHDNHIRGGAGDDVLTGGANANYLNGGAGSDILAALASTGYNTMIGGAGQDVLRGGDNGNTLDGGSGADTMVGGEGGDKYYVDNKSDSIYETYVPYFDNDPNPADTVFSSVSWSLGANLENLELTGPKTINGRGNSLDNQISGNALRNKLWGLDGDDTISGGRGADTIRGGRGRDTLSGDQGNDFLTGGGGADKLLGGAGNDRLFGDNGVDRLTGGTGDDQLTGGANKDIFIFQISDGSDTILDFELGKDKIKIVSGANGFEDLNIQQTGTDTQVQFADVEITLVGIDDLQSITSDMFIF